MFPARTVPALQTGDGAPELTLRVLPYKTDGGGSAGGDRQAATIGGGLFFTIALTGYASP